MKFHNQYHFYYNLPATSLNTIAIPILRTKRNGIGSYGIRPYDPSDQNNYKFDENFEDYYNKPIKVTPVFIKSYQIVDYIFQSRKN